MIVARWAILDTQTEEVNYHIPIIQQNHMIIK
jgi:hypothetical protein